MKKGYWMLVIGLMVGVLIGIGATAAFAAGPTAGASDNATGVWQQMYQACQSGDFATMQQLYNQYCAGPNGMMGNWQGRSNAQQTVPGNGSGRQYTPGYGGMMGGWQGNGSNQQYAPGYGGGMMGGW